MNKVVFPEANEALSESLQGQFTTFIDNEKFYGHVKQASSNAITREMLEDCKPDKDHFLIHFVGVGDYEKYGFNKNADSFPKTANIKYHKTFETDGKLYREHQSSDPNKAIGIIKRAEYNPEMGRIEVAVWANIKKASDAYELARSGGTLSCSMGMRCPYDRDNISGKLSKTPASYEPWMKKCAGQYIDTWDGKPIHKYAFVHNDKFRFFDLSIVAKPAERIAHYLEYKFASDNSNEMLKAAAEGESAIPSALLAEAMDLRSSNKLPMSKLATLKRLVDLESKFTDIMLGKNIVDVRATQYVKHAAVNSFYKKASKESEELNKNIGQLKQVKPETLFRELAKRASVLPFNSFMDVFYDESLVKDPVLHNKAVKLASVMIIPNVFKNLMDDMTSLDPMSESCCSAEDLFDMGSLAETACDTSKDPVQEFMDSIEDKLSLEPEKRGNRVIKITITLNLDELDKQNKPEDICCVKEASSYLNDKEVIKLAKRYANEYALYKISALNDIASLHGGESKFLDDLTLYTTIAQNYTQV